ncbi:hypothetical protein F5X99DRAFT_364423 [Biscogniauxia marginata]|nr:hypothetical protein F5X99DRAFT_364423 [Biscogniauxia marginata]
MPDNDVTGNNVVATASIESSDHVLGVEESVPIVVSDILQPSQNHGPQTSLPHQEIPQTPKSRLGKEQHLTSTQASMSPSTTRLAVHIRSSTTTPHLSFTKMGQAESVPPDRSRIPQSKPNQPRREEKAAEPSSSAGNNKEGSGFQPKKRGRPKGWKPGMRYADPKTKERKKQAEPANSQEPKRRGRPPRAPGRTVREQYLRSNPDYTPFKCEWVESQQASTCPAELQNMQTLRKHVFFVHGDAIPLVCRWSKCATKETPPEFTDVEDFEEHVEKEHLRSYLWYMGEGYKNDGISTIEQDPGKLPSYLFDKDGKQVTPSIIGQKLEDDQQHKERKRKLKRLLIQQNENAPDEEEYIRQTLGMA